ncbi:MAG: TonB-dependent receptor plug domain-containing protein, partial [Ferruginibacter sp.]
MKKNLTAGEKTPPMHFDTTRISKWFFRFLFLFLLGICTSNVFAQKPTQNFRIISGTVRDEKGDPLAGVTVSVKGNGATAVVKGANAVSVTNATGHYALHVPDGNSVVVFSYVGMDSKEQKVGTANNIDISLAVSDPTLSDVVVVGYAKQKKATLTGAVEQISAKTFENRAVTNIGLALQGATPGLLVTRSSPRPGNEGIGLVIRGLSSVNGSAPLIIIDGVPALNSFSFLNMNGDDIESISVLKDASAAIYGSAAANGVILVSTKRGKGKTRYDFSSNMRFATNGITGYSPSMQQY